ncbi:MerR family transcriptional regulator [Bacillus cereus group sp. BY5-1LC]|uniref:MerR family transcriptional regulator n=1 Tax=Bacillus cereus group sp. BY5-1LC TaxID=3018078 RepID=UPI0022DF00B8|nr:MerR family transcriptional regulator [Bacillus cereus group sp. BY5-1LC]MDA1792131.1 MerR family transcriptional regulator [Bacillus cereus group sp. BY5-1LC]
MNDYGYFAKTVAENLGISPNTLRRWSLELEKQGYEFDRSDANKRIYYEKDIKAFRELKSLLDAAVSMENATKTIVNTTETRDNELVTPIVREQRKTDLQPVSANQEDFKLMMQQVMAEIASNTIQPLMDELKDVKSELTEQREENKKLAEQLQLKLNETGEKVTNTSEKLLLESGLIKKQLEDKTTENEKLKNLLEEVKAKTEQIQKQTEQEEMLNKINRNIKSFDDRLKETVEQKKQEQNKSFFQRLFNK